MGLRYEDFCDLTPDEFTHIYRAYSNEREALYKDNWERVRLIAAAAVLPYAKKGETMYSLYPLPWDGNIKPEPTRKAPAEHVSKEEALQRFEEVLEKVDKG